jgi:putative addiction module component (TIGR02574 family)
MGQPLTVPPPGFDDLSVDEQIDFVQALWTRIAETQRSVPSPDWHRDVVRQRLVDHRSKPDRARPWSDARSDVEKKIKQR